MENFIFLLSMLFNLRFKVQDALFRALYRSQQWLGRCVDLLGIGSIQAQNFIIFSYVQLANDFHDALSAATLLPRSATDTLLATIDAIPQSEYRSYRDVQFTQTFNNFASKLPEGTLCHSKYLQASFNSYSQPYDT
jgi:hypothetical protein